MMAQISVLIGMDPNNNNNNSTQESSERVQNLLKTLTIEQKIAQLFMPGMQLNDPNDFEKVTDLIKKYSIGGVLLTKLLTHTSISEIAFNYIQCLHHTNKVFEHPIPIWISMDAEWGPAMRLTYAICFPKAMTLAATADTKYSYECGKEIGRQLEELGIHINLAPVVDVNNNPANPVIGVRSFGENPKQIFLMAAAYWAGITDKIISCIKHFPGHGDTNIDSHRALPVINHSIERLQEVELKPFKAFIDMGIPMIMVAHLLIPALDKELPASLSPVIIDLLRKQLGFKGLVITDGLKMDAVSKKYNSKELALLAFKAGNDIILQLEDTQAGIEALVDAYKQNIITQEQIDEHVERILQAKVKQNLFNQSPYPEIEDISKKINAPHSYELQKRLYAAAMTLVNNDNHVLPILESDVNQTFLIDIDDSGAVSFFGEKLESKGILTIHQNNKTFDVASVDLNIERIVRDYKKIIIRIGSMNQLVQESYGIGSSTKYLCHRLQDENCTIVLCGTPYAASLFEKQGLLVAYEDNRAAQLAAADVVLGTCPTGKLPVSIGIRYPAGTGISF